MPWWWPLPPPRIPHTNSDKEAEMGRKQDADKAPNEPDTLAAEIEAPNEPDTLAAEIDALPECVEKTLARKYLGHVRGGRNVPTDRHTLDCLIAEAKRKAEAGRS